MLKFIYPPSKPKPVLPSKRKIRRFIKIYNQAIKAGNLIFHYNCGLPSLTDEEFKIVKDRAKDSGYILLTEYLIVNENNKLWKHYKLEPLENKLFNEFNSKEPPTADIEKTKQFFEAVRKRIANYEFNLDSRQIDVPRLNPAEFDIMQLELLKLGYLLTHGRGLFGDILYNINSLLLPKPVPITEPAPEPSSFIESAIPSEAKETIICSAIWYKELPLVKNDLPQRHIYPTNINKGIVFCGHRHLQCMYSMIALTGKRSVKPECGGYTQGFLTNKNRFVTRKEAAKIATAAGQIIHSREVKTLHSEDIY